MQLGACLVPQDRSDACKRTGTDHTTPLPFFLLQLGSAVLWTLMPSDKQMEQVG